MQDEGYVKYTCHHSAGPAPEHESWQELNDLRTDLVKAGLIGVLENGVGYGNVSLRTAEGLFLVSATSTGHIAELGPQHYCLVTSCDVDANTVWSRGPMQASSESMTHAAVYAASPETGVVIHLHHAGLFGQLIEGQAPATAPEAAFGTPAMARSVEELVRRHPADGIIAMTGHPDGFIMYAPNVAHMRDLLYMLSQGYIPC